MYTPYIALANQAMHAKEYDLALMRYLQAQQAHPQLAHLVDANISVSENRLIRSASKYRPRFEPEAASVDIVVPVYNAVEDVQRCLASLEKHMEGHKVRIIVVNDGSDHATTAWLRARCARRPHFQLIEHGQNLGYTRAVNTGLRASTAPYVITQNSDTIVTTGWLSGLIRCMDSDPAIGIVGPLSNAASWQNVPTLRDESGGFAVNELPLGMNVEAMAELVAKVSKRRYPRVRFVNGFCFMIRRQVLETIGYMDEVNFPVGYGEENDFCIRATDAGFTLAIADDVYVYHAKSKSFGHTRRHELSKAGSAALLRKHSQEKISRGVEEIKSSTELLAIREEVSAELKKHITDHACKPLLDARILFLLPVTGSGGGIHSVVQEAAEMDRLGIVARIGVKKEHLPDYEKNYEDIPNIKRLLVGFDDTNIIQIAEDYHVVIATIYSSVRLLKKIAEGAPEILPAYYVQDYEPLFFPPNSENWEEARTSYTLVPNALLFAKTQWIIDRVEAEHKVHVHKVRPSLDHGVYKPGPRGSGSRIRIAAMIRPQTPRRGAARTMRLLSRLAREFPTGLDIHIFGCPEERPDFQALQRDFLYTNHGVLTRPEVAKLLSSADLFIDLSDYQAFGRTGLEAMASGCAVVLPAEGGVYEYARDGENAVIVDPHDEAACFAAIRDLVADPARLRTLQLRGLETAANYSIHSSAISEVALIWETLQRHKLEFSAQSRRTVGVLLSRQKGGQPTSSGYVRLVLPYQTAAVRSRYKVRFLSELPKPGEFATVVFQRQALGLSLDQLQSWIEQHKARQGRCVLEIDDDLLDTEGLRQRGYVGDVGEVVKKVEYLARNADAVTVSTPPLAERLVTLNDNVFVVPNCLDPELWRLNERRTGSKRFGERSSPIRIGYMGTPTHDQDLQLVVDAMRKLELIYGNRIEIEVIGAFEGKTPLFGKRVGLPRRHDYPNFVRWLLQRVQWDIGIIPLADDKFNESKSYLKFLEYAALGLSIVVSRVPTYLAVAKHEVNCLVADPDTDAWVSAVSRLIEDPSLRMRLAENARADLIEHHCWPQGTSKILEALG